VVNSIAEKLIRRHPHVFGEARIEDAEAQSSAWELHKEQERQAKAPGERISLLDGVTKALPALTRACKLQKRAARAGFDWDDIEPVTVRVEEELDEVRKALAGNCKEHVQDEVGDLLFTCVNLARFVQVDPETALRNANAKFERRFRYIEKALAERGRTPEQASLDEMDNLWEEAKREEKG
jgi:MazG family protein